jgi:hypothetical protein
MPLLKFVGEDFLFLAALRTPARKRPQVLEHFKSGAVLGGSHFLSPFGVMGYGLWVAGQEPSRSPEFITQRSSLLSSFRFFHFKLSPQSWFYAMPKCIEPSFLSVALASSTVRPSFQGSMNPHSMSFQPSSS